MEFDMPEQTSGGPGNYLRTPGVYHFSVNRIDDQHKSREGKPFNGLKVEVQVLAPKAEEGKTATLSFNTPSTAAKDGGEFARRKMGCLFIATGLVKPTQLGQKVSVDLAAAIGRQVIAKVELDEKDQKYIDLSYSDIFHVDDPNALKCERNERAISQIPAAHRLKAEDFPKPEPRSARRDNGSTAADSGAVDLDAL